MAIDAVSSILGTVEPFLDYIPRVSTVSNVIILIAKAVFSLMPKASFDKIKNNHLVTVISLKGVAECLLLSIPYLNIVVAVCRDFPKLFSYLTGGGESEPTEKPTQPAQEQSRKAQEVPQQRAYEPSRKAEAVPQQSAQEQSSKAETVPPVVSNTETPLESKLDNVQQQIERSSHAETIRRGRELYEATEKLIAKSRKNNIEEQEKRIKEYQDKKQALEKQIRDKEEVLVGTKVNEKWENERKQIADKIARYQTVIDSSIKMLESYKKASGQLTAEQQAK